jgi:ABC-type multidrug transport system fused ATPase/permease subunit
VKAFANEISEIKKFKAKNDKAFEIGNTLSIWQGALTFFIQFTINGAMAGIIYYGSGLQLQSSLSLSISISLIS